MRRVLPLAAVLLLLCVCASRPVPAEEPNANAQSYSTQANPETLVLDARDVGRGLMTATMRIPVKPGEFTFVYPKWVSGEHGPTGPIADVSEIKVSAGGQPLEWRRDLVDMYAFHVQVPAGVTELQASLDTITYNGKSSLASSKVLDLVWNQVLLYPQGVATDAVQVTASVCLPE